MNWGVQKPTLGARIDWSHPLAQRLAYCALFNEGAGTGLINAVTNKADIFGFPPDWTGRVGGGLDFNTGTAFVACPGLSDTPYLGPLTLVWRGVIDTGSAFRHFAGKHPSANQDIPFDFRTDNSATPVLALVRGGTGANNFREHTGPATTLGALKQYAVTTTAATIETVPTFYVDATATTGTVGTIGGGGGTGAATGTGADLRIGQRIDAAVQMDGVCTSLLIYSRALTGGEIARLVESPYAFMQPSMLSRWRRAAAA